MVIVINYWYVSNNHPCHQNEVEKRPLIRLGSIEVFTRHGTNNISVQSLLYSMVTILTRLAQTTT